MTKRPIAELRLLMDAAQVAMAVGTLVVLALPWWGVRALDDFQVVSGWGALDDKAVAHGWLLLVAVAVAVVAVVVNSAGAHIVACVVAGLAGLVMLVGLLNLRGSQDYHLESGAWIGLVLLLGTVVVQGLAAFGPE